ncbi:SMI1/KNR4 family protein [Myxococcus stipitatus]|uniref:SMI1/KNR4 family protein n=1 Tax=Myxococcus stipitatus TaxID=83455 RepID=UPI001F211E48|nr:SMI1/KNR4 family protein [Myxococcus stipitatus]MCE9668292.1 SMI1/KNR4 family protein [Myxococcus stipitatus]
MTLDTLLDEVVRAHFPRPPATAERIAAFEERMGWRLDADLRAFYLRCDGAELFKPLPDSNYSILSLDDIERACVRLRRRDQGAPERASFFPLVDCQDSDWVLVDVTPTGGPYPLLDAYHETYPREVRRIAESFQEFLSRALRGSGHLYWLE